MCVPSVWGWACPCTLRSQSSCCPRHGHACIFWVWPLWFDLWWQKSELIRVKISAACGIGFGVTAFIKMLWLKASYKMHVYIYTMHMHTPTNNLCSRNAGCRNANMWEWKDAARQLILCNSLIIKTRLWHGSSQASGKGFFNEKEKVETCGCPLMYTVQTVNGMMEGGSGKWLLSLKTKETRSWGFEVKFEEIIVVCSSLYNLSPRQKEWA